MFRIGTKLFIAPRPLYALVPRFYAIKSDRLRGLVFSTLVRISKEA